MFQSKNRKLTGEGRVFNEKWTDEYFFIELRNGELYQICEETVSVFKVNNVKRHYLQKNAAKWTYIKDFFKNEKF